jgi:hypothetical protein
MNHETHEKKPKKQNAASGKFPESGVFLFGCGGQDGVVYCMWRKILKEVLVMDEGICQEIKMDEQTCLEIRKKLRKATVLHLLFLILVAPSVHVLLLTLFPGIPSRNFFVTAASVLVFAMPAFFFFERYKESLRKKYPDYLAIIEGHPFIKSTTEENEAGDRALKSAGIVFPLGAFAVILFAITLAITKSVLIAMIPLIAIGFLTLFFLCMKT